MRDSGMRVSDAERDRAAELLSEHALAGRITDAEVAARSRRAHLAVTRGDLRSLFGDLPEPHPLPAEATPEASTPGWTAPSQFTPTPITPTQVEPTQVEPTQAPWPTRDPTSGDGPSGTAGSGTSNGGTSGSPWPTMDTTSTPPEPAREWPTMGSPAGTDGQSFRPADSQPLASREQGSGMASYPASPPAQQPSKAGEAWMRYLWFAIPAVVLISVFSEGRMAFLIPLLIIGAYAYHVYRKRK